MPRAIGSTLSWRQIFIGPYLRLESDIYLADVVQRGENAQARRRCVVDVVPTGGARQSPADYRLLQQRFETRSYVRQMMFEQMYSGVIVPV